tara:strand:+ start:12243 stop:12488 length:246 start_codon:yes stop_codon:yes gene_type:complete
MYSHDPSSKRIISVYIHVDDVAGGHDYMDVGGRATQGVVAEESEATTYRMYSHDPSSKRIISVYIHVDDVAGGHDYMDVRS